MRVKGKLFLFIILLVGFNSCFEPPHFSIVPVIGPTMTVDFYNNSVDTSSDSLVISFPFKDGDGDLGFDQNNPNDKSEQYRNTYYFNRKGQTIDFGTQEVTSKYFYNSTRPGSGSTANDTLLSFVDKRNGIDSLPDFVVPYLCTRWAVIGSPATDTLYINLNPNYYNIFIDIYTVDPNTFQYVLFDWNSPDRVQSYTQCQPQGFDSRFPILSSDSGHSGPQEGNFQWTIASPAWIPIFNNDLMQLRITIQDRALHRSNLLTSSNFTLAGITRN